MFTFGCASVYNTALGKKELIFISSSQEVALGKLLNAQMKMQLTTSNDEALNKRLKKIGNRIALNSDRTDLNYSFNVAEDKELNAFALPGGFIYVNSGLMEKATDDELACVLAHEIGHVAAKHSVKRLQVSLGYSIVMSLAFNKAEYVDTIQAMNTVFNYVSLGYSRNDERQADTLAVKYAYKSGFNPEGIISFFKKLQEEAEKQNRSQQLVFLSSHPPINERIKYTEENITKINNNQSLFDCNLKICPKCNKTYPKQYDYCQDDGTKLICR